MANIKLKSLITEAEDFQARSKETGKLVHFKSKDAYQAALKAGSHEDPKAKKGGEPKAAAKPNDMFGGDYAKDRGGEAPKSKEISNDDIEGLTSYKDFTKFYKANSDKLNKEDVPYIEDQMGALKYLEYDYESGDADTEELLVAYEELQDLFKRALTKEAPKADVKSIVKGLLKTANKEFAGTHKLKDIVDNVEFDTMDDDGKDLQSRIDKGEDGIYVQTDETEGTIVFSDGTQYQLHHVEDGPIPVTKVGKEEPKTSSKSTSDDGFGWGPETDRRPATSLPKKASQLDSKHSKMIQDVVNAEAGLDGYIDTDDNTGAFMYNVGKGDMPTYTLYFGSNDDYGKPDEFRVTLEPTYGNDPSGLEGKIDKSFKSADESMKYMVAVAKKYKKELEMDDEDTNESTKLTSMIKK